MLSSMAWTATANANRRFGTEIFILIALNLCLILAQSSTSSKDRTTNFIVFFVDDLGYGDLGFTGRCDNNGQKTSDFVTAM